MTFAKTFCLVIEASLCFGCGFLLRTVTDLGTTPPTLLTQGPAGGLTEKCALAALGGSALPCRKHWPLDGEQSSTFQSMLKT